MDIEDEKGLIIIKRVMLGIGTISFLVGLVRQWPVLGKGYMAFIEGKGYMALIMGLIIIILGISVRLFVIDDFGNRTDHSVDGKSVNNSEKAE